METATITLYLPFGDAQKLRIAEISNWSGQAFAAPRTELETLLHREELEGSGVYFLLGTNPETGKPLAYIGEAEDLSNRLKGKDHSERQFWISVVVFLSKDDNLTKAHVRYLEKILIEEAKAVARYELDNVQASNAKLPEFGQADMKVFLKRIKQLLPVLGTDILVEIKSLGEKESVREIHNYEVLNYEVKGVNAKGERTEQGFVVYEGSKAVLNETDGCKPYIKNLRHKLIEESILQKEDNAFIFTKNAEFASPSTAASVIAGSSINGLTAWRYSNGMSIKDFEIDE
ncbi:MAG: GIY-YIG nuclease family protein [Trueperaceae bacterium]